MLIEPPLEPEDLRLKGHELIDLLRPYHARREVFSGLFPDAQGEGGSHVTAFGTRDPAVGRHPRHRVPFLAPEQTGRLDASLGPEADLYNWGACLCWWATGVPLWPTEGPVPPLRRVLNEVPDVSWADEPQWPRGLKALLETVLFKNPEERYRSLEGLENDWSLIWRHAERGMEGLIELKTRDFPELFSAPSHLLDREEALGLASRAVGQARSRQGPALCSLTGATGLGKSRWLRTCVEDLGRPDEGWFLLDGSADRAGPYGTLRGLLEQMLVHPAWEDDVFRERIFQALSIETGESAAVLSRIVPSWEGWAGPEASDRESELRALKTRLDFAWAALLRSWLRQAPLVLAIDDAERLGRETLDILELVLGGAEGVRAACLVTSSLGVTSSLASLPLFAPENRFEAALEPVSLEALRVMARQLPAHTEQVEPLVEALSAKTQGIPRSLERFWERLRELDAVRPDRATLSWWFDLPKVHALQVPESSMAWFRSRLENLDGDATRLLELLSLFPGGLDHGDLNAAWNEVFGPRQQGWAVTLGPLVRTGWVIKEPAWALASPLLAEAIRGLQTPEESRLLKAGLARFRLHVSPPESPEEIRLFAVALASLPPNDREAYAPLLLEACDVLIRQGAHESACDLLNLVSAHVYLRLEGGPLATLVLLQVTALAGRREAFAQLTELLSDSYRSPELGIEFDHAITHGWLNMGDLEPALASGIEAIARQGIALPTHPQLFDVIRASIPLQLALRGLKLTTLLELPTAQGRTQALLLDLMQNISSAAFFHRPLLVPILTAANIRHGLRAGLSAGLAVSFATLAFQQAVVFRNPGLASRTLIWADELARRFPSPGEQARIDFLAWTFIRWWDLPLAGVGSALLSNARKSLALGQLDTGFNSFLVGVYYELWGGQSISIVARHVAEQSRALELRGNSQNLALLQGLRAFLAVQAGGDWESFQSSLAHLESYRLQETWTTYFSLGGLVQLAEFLEGKPSQRKSIADNLLTHLNVVGLSTYGNPAILVLASVQRLTEGSVGPRSPLVVKTLKLLRALSQKGGTTFRAHLSLIEGLVSFRQGRWAPALMKVSSAVELFLQGNQPLFGALSLEARARIYEHQDLTELARKDWRTAYWTWRDLGYLRHSAILASTRPYLSPDSGTSAEGGSRLEALETFARATLDLMNQPTRDALAQKVAELFGDGGQEKVLVLSLQGQTWHRWGPLAGKISRRDAPHLLLHRAWDHHGPLVVDGHGLAKEGDPFLRNHRGSLAIIPLVREGRCLALVYLEHPLLPGAFPERRIEALVPLATQAAVAFESRSLLEEMEDRVARRNLDLVKERDRSEALLLNILPRAAAEELKETGRTRARLFPEVTVLFLDFVNFTTAAAHMEAQELVDLIDEYFSGFDRLVGQFGLEKIKTMGDAYMAVAGLPEGGSAAAPTAVEAARAMLSFVQEVATKREQRGLKGFQARVGLHTGSVVAGVVGTRKFQFDIWGDTVNLAARMEQNSEPDRINVSHSTWTLVKDRFETQHRGRLAAKNKGEVDMYFVL